MGYVSWKFIETDTIWGKFDPWQRLLGAMIIMKVLVLLAINTRKKAKEISTFDFSTLYTKLPHDKLIKELHKLIDFVFEGGERKYVKINKRGKASRGKKFKDSTRYTH